MKRELTLRGDGTRVNALREQVEDKTSYIVKQVYRGCSEDQHLDHQK